MVACVNPQEEDAIIQDICEALDAAERAGTPAQALATLAWHAGVEAWWHPRAVNARKVNDEHQRGISFQVPESH